MTRHQWLWLFIWILIFFSIFCVWNKTKLLYNDSNKTGNLVVTDNLYKKNITLKALKDNLSSVKISGEVSDKSIKDEIVDAYSKVFDSVEQSELLVKDDIKVDDYGVDMFSNFAEDFSHFNGGYISYDGNLVEIDGETDNSVTRGSITEKISLLKDRNLHIEDHLTLTGSTTGYIPKTKQDDNLTNDEVNTSKPEISENQQRLKKIKEVEDIQKSINAIMKDKRVEFLYAKDALTSGSKELVDNIIDIVKENNQTIIEISGHTDSDGTKKRNLALSTKRAVSVKNYMVSKGLKESQLKAIGYGESRPLVKNTTKKNKQKNRRVEFKVIGESK